MLTDDNVGFKDGATNNVGGGRLSFAMRILDIGPISRHQQKRRPLLLTTSTTVRMATRHGPDLTSVGVLLTGENSGADCLGGHSDVHFGSVNRQDLREERARWVNSTLTKVEHCHSHQAGTVLSKREGRRPLDIASNLLTESSQAR